MTILQGEIFIFGPFQLSVSSREILCRGVPVQLGTRAFDLLLAPVRRHGQLATKDVLMAEVWPGSVVGEDNLKAQISSIRKVLGGEPGCSGYLRSVPGRGYRFLAPVEIRSDTAAVNVLTSLSLPDRPSIAVLPFTNMSVDPEQEYFADGIAEDVITALARFPSLFVIARNSSFTYKGRAVDIRQVGHELGVRYVLEGSVRKVGNRVRITGQLIETETGSHVWADRYENDLVDIFSLQDEMTASIVGALVPGLQRAEIERARLKPPDSLGAYDYYLRALAAYHAWTKQGNDQALALLDKALQLDPNFVAAVILAENCWGLRYTRGWSPVKEAVEQSTRLARLAVQLNPDNPDALAVLGRRTASINHDYAGAMLLAEQAVAGNPNSSFAWRHAAWAFAFCGKPEKALAYFERALRLSPREARTHDLAGPNNGIALALIQMGRDREAVAAARASIQQSPDSAGGWRMLTSALALLGKLDEARDALLRVLELDPTCSLETIYLRFGHSEEARARFYEGLRKAGMPD